MALGLVARRFAIVAGAEAVAARLSVLGKILGAAWKLSHCA
jgi:hypothetical protein